MIQAAIFDIDGTLLDTERIYVRAWQIAAREMGYEIPDDLMRRPRAISAKAAAEILEREIGNGFSYAKVRVRRHEIAEEMLDRESPVLKSGALSGGGGFPRRRSGGKRRGYARSAGARYRDHHTGNHRSMLHGVQKPY